MKNKIETKAAKDFLALALSAKTLKILIAFAVMVFVMGAARAACTNASAEGPYIKLSQNVSCAGDDIIAYVGNIQGCEGKNVTVYVTTLAGVIQSSATCLNSDDMIAACFVRMPNILGKIKIIMDIKDFYNGTNRVNVTTVTNINTASRSGICYDWRNREYFCQNNCTDQQPQRLWSKVAPVSLPLHFSFAIENTNSSPATALGLACGNAQRGRSYSINCGSINCGCTLCSALGCAAGSNVSNWVWGGFGYYKCDNTKGCTDALAYYQNNTLIGCTECQYTTMRAYRYSYAWDFSYDMAAFVYNTTEYVPMFVGYNQSATSSGSNVTGDCGNGALCYTEVPICGDGICDTTGGERCWNCEKDCSCKRFGLEKCSLCPTGDFAFSDAKSCVLRRKNEGETCNCNLDMCGNAASDGQKLECRYEDTNRSRMDVGRCCHSNEFWNGTHCVVLRKLVVNNVNIELKQKTGSWDWVTRACCRPDRIGSTAWLKMDFKVVNEGVVNENYTVNTYMVPESSAAKPGSFDVIRGNPPISTYPQTETPIAGGETKSHTIEIACARFDTSKCDQTRNWLWGYINNTGQYLTSSGGVSAPLIRYLLSVENDNCNRNSASCPYGSKFNGHDYPSPLVVDELACSTLPEGDRIYCMGSTGQIKTGSSNANYMNGLCGGWATPGEMPASDWLKGWVPFVGFGYGCLSAPYPDTFCVPIPYPPFFIPLPSALCFINCQYEGGCS